jgi:hypothetical protein
VAIFPKEDVSASLIPDPRSFQTLESVLNRIGENDMTTATNTKAHKTQTESRLEGPLSREELRKIDAYWRAANYLSVGQIYLYDNPLLRKPLSKDHIKPRLLGHWGTTPGLNFIYAHLNRVIKKNDLEIIFITGPGHGGPGVVANTYLEGTYSEVYPNISQDEGGMQRLFKQFSFPGGIPSHAAPETPGSIHEGGELGYALSHAYGAVFDNPNLIVAAVVGDGEAETGPLATSWHSNKFDPDKNARYFELEKFIETRLPGLMDKLMKSTGVMKIAVEDFMFDDEDLKLLGAVTVVSGRYGGMVIISPAKLILQNRHPEAS